MKCVFSENDIALYIEGDLPEASLRKIEAHLRECTACCDLAEDFRESQSIFRTLRAETVSAAAMAGVRNRVLAEVSGIRSSTVWGRKLERFLYSGFRRGFVTAGLTAFVIAAGIVLWPAEEVPLPPRIAVVSTPPVQTVVVPAVHKAAAVRRKKAREPVQTVVKLLTDDPNIVIYWVVSENGGD